MQKVWDARLGTYHYDDAVRAKGPPQQKETLSDGFTVAVWIDHSRGTRYSQPMYNAFDGSYIGSTQVDTSYTDRLELGFDQDGILAAWRWRRN